MPTPRLTLERFAYFDRATAGRLRWPGGFVWTLEDPWIRNEPNVSCIPEGWYELRRDTFRGLYPNFRFEHVVGRSAIEIHKGNTTADTSGCVLLGESLVLGIDGQVAIPATRSGPAFDRFMAAMAGIDAAVIAVRSAVAP
jgi:uncharacterized protein DUF5675